jgi:hypothetical protein
MIDKSGFKNCLLMAFGENISVPAMNYKQRCLGYDGSLAPYQIQPT